MDYPGLSVAEKLVQQRLPFRSSHFHQTLSPDGNTLFGPSYASPICRLH